MKKAVSFLMSVILVMCCTVVVFAASDSTPEQAEGVLYPISVVTTIDGTVIEYYEDGVYVVNYFGENSSIQTRSSFAQQSGYSIVYDSYGTAVLKLTVYGTFEYNAGSSVWCNRTNPVMTDYGCGWKYSDVSSSNSGSGATCTASASAWYWYPGTAARSVTARVTCNYYGKVV